MKRVLLIGVAAVVVIIVAAVVLLYSNLDSIVKAAIERVGSQATQTKVTLDSVKISPTSGEGSLKGFRLGNPAGFKTESAMRFGEVSVKVDVASVTSNVIVIKEVVIGAPQVTYEIDTQGGSNISTIQKNVDAFAKSMGTGQAGAAKPEATKESGGKKVVIDNLYIRDGKVSVAAAFLAGREMGASLPTIHLTNIGKDKGGATPAEVADKILSSITQAATKAVSQLGIDKMMKQGVEGAQKMMEGGAGDAKKAIEGGTKGVGDTVKGLFGK